MPYEDAYDEGFEELGRRKPDTTAHPRADRLGARRCTVDDAIRDVIAFERAAARRGLGGCRLRPGCCSASPSRSAIVYMRHPAGDPGRRPARSSTTSRSATRATRARRRTSAARRSWSASSSRVLAARSSDWDAHAAARRRRGWCSGPSARSTTAATLAPALRVAVEVALAAVLWQRRPRLGPRARRRRRPRADASSGSSRSSTPSTCSTTWTAPRASMAAVVAAGAGASSAWSTATPGSRSPRRALCGACLGLPAAQPAPRRRGSSSATAAACRSASPSRRS